MERNVRIHLNSPIESSLIRRIIKHLEELTPPQVEHELRINHEIIVEPEACWIVLSVIGELLTKSDQHTI